MDFRFGMDPLFLVLFVMCLVITSSQSQSNQTSGSYQLSRKPCQVKGQEGTCMFVWECVKTEGTPLGMCMERFMFGSCCSHDLDNNVVPSSSSTPASSHVPTNQPTTVLTTSLGQPSSSSILTAIITSRPLTGWLNDGTSSSPPTVTSSTAAGTSGSTSGQDAPAITSAKHNASSTTSIPSVTTASPNLIISTETSTMAIDNQIVVTQPPSGSQSTSPHHSSTTTTATTTNATHSPMLLASNSGASDNKSMSSPPSSFNSTTTAPPTLSTSDVEEMLDLLVALSTVPTNLDLSSMTTTEIDSTTIPASPIDLSDSLAIFNELNTTADVPDSILTVASNRPDYNPSSTTQQSLPSVTTPSSTTTTTVSTTTASTTTKVTAPAVVTTNARPPINITNILGIKNNSTDGNKKPIMSVTSLPSSYPNIECGIPPLLKNRQEGRIVGGSNSKFGSWPWQVSVRRTSFFGFSSTHRCGGALLNELWVITAGHCVEDLLISQIRLRMGEYDFSSVSEPYPFVERGVNKKIVHPKYNFFTYEYDLALVRLEEPITFQPNIAPICLPATDENLIGQNGTVTGWGRLSEGGTLPSMLQQVTVPIVSNDKCKDMFLKAGRHEYIPDIFMCAGFEEGGRDSCQGDSGGPLQIRGRDGRYFLAGIISWGIGCAEANLPGVCTRISKFTPWILENVT